MRHTKVNLPPAFSQCCCLPPTLGQHILDAAGRSKPLTSCGCASMQRESTRGKMAGCSSRGTLLPAAAQHAKLHHLEAITCRCPLFTHLSRVQLTGSFCSFQLKVVHEATLGRGSLKQLISVYNMWVITHTPQHRVSSLLETLQQQTERSPSGVLQKRNAILVHWFAISRSFSLSFDYKRN